MAGSDGVEGAGSSAGVVPVDGPATGPVPAGVSGLSPSSSVPTRASSSTTPAATSAPMSRFDRVAGRAGGGGTGRGARSISVGGCSGRGTVGRIAVGGSVG
ncbi:hypothetical protein B0E53_06924 [Micromonospora sp. MH33]|nr:hypothetical protein B0E53_06924 [Micromonospora sp. MH33]